MSVHTYTNWNSRPSDKEEQIEPFRKYFFICEGANTATFYFRRLIDIKKQLDRYPSLGKDRGRQKSLFCQEAGRICGEPEEKS